MKERKGKIVIDDDDDDDGDEGKFVSCLHFGINNNNNT